MTQTNEATVAADTPGAAITAVQGVNTMFGPEQIQDLLVRLSEPFDPAVVEWRVTNTSGKRGQVVAYADQRAYTDRLNDLFTPAGWTREYTVQTVQNFEVPRKDGKSTIITAKVMVTSKVTIHGLGAHSGTGEEWAIDENALTRAEAQAFKRACSCFGLGRYFYDLPRTWVDLDENRRPLQVPALPEWALPKMAASTVRERSSSGREPSASRHGAGISGKSNTSKSRSAPARHSTNGTSQHAADGRRSNGLYGDELRHAVSKLAEEVGFSLTRSVVQAVAGKDEIDSVQNNAQMTSLMDKLTDLARGVRRLRTATEKAGAGVYGSLCQELNLASDAIDDIPNREVLRELVSRMEAAAAETTRGVSNGAAGSSSAGPNGPNGSADDRRSAPVSNGTSATGITHLRERLLIEARRISTARRKGIGDVIALASKGAFGFADLTKLTDADADRVEAALVELGRMAV